MDDSWRRYGSVGASPTALRRVRPEDRSPAPEARLLGKANLGQPNVPKTVSAHTQKRLPAPPGAGSLFSLHSLALLRGFLPFLQHPAPGTCPCTRPACPRSPPSTLGDRLAADVKYAVSFNMLLRNYWKLRY